MLKYLENKLKEKIFHYEVSEEDDNTIFEKTNTKIGLYANYMVIFFIILSIIVIFFDSIPGNKEKYLGGCPKNPSNFAWIFLCIKKKGFFFGFI